MTQNEKLLKDVLYRLLEASPNEGRPSDPTWGSFLAAKKAARAALRVFENSVRTELVETLKKLKDEGRLDDVAKSLRLKKSDIQKWETGSHVPNDETLADVFSA